MLNAAWSKVGKRAALVRRPETCHEALAVLTVERERIGRKRRRPSEIDVITAHHASG
jgi:hypothetical protein